MAKSKKIFWWPFVIAKQIKWWKNFPKAVLEYQDELEVTDDELTQIQEDSAMFISLFKNDSLLEDYKKELLTYRRDVIEGKIRKSAGNPPVLTLEDFPTTVDTAMMTRTFSFVTSIRGRSGFTSTIAIALQIIGDDIPAFDKDKFVAKGRGTTAFDSNSIGFTKGRFIDGVGIWRQRGDDPEFYFGIIK